MRNEKGGRKGFIKGEEVQRALNVAYSTLTLQNSYVCILKN